MGQKAPDFEALTTQGTLRLVRARTYGTNERVLQPLFCFNKNIEEVKKVEEIPANVGRKTVEMIDFEEAEAEKLELVKRHLGLKQNKEVIKALISEKCDDIKLAVKKKRKQQIEEATAMEYLEKGEYKCPM